MAIAREFRETLYKSWLKRNQGPDLPGDMEFTDDDAMQID